MRPILKRPSPLPLTPAVPAASFSSLFSPRAIKSSSAPHVRFPSSPKLVATISTYSSDAYDRLPISISPNPVALPGWAPKVFRSLADLASHPSPVIPGFEDPRSPRLQLAADVTGTKPANNTVRFATMAATHPTPPARTQALGMAVVAYPRSPYPSAIARQGDPNRGKQLPRSANDISETARARPWVQSHQDRLANNNRNKLGLTLDRPIGSSSPLSNSFGSATSSINRSNKPAPLALESDSTESEKLSNAFWNSVSIESANDPMVTALEYPESAIEYEEKMDIGLRSASQPPLMFANADGVLFSPGLPKPHYLRVERLFESIQQMTSPSVNNKSFIPIARKEVTAPSPNDPFAAFPSFGAVLEKVGMDSSIHYPAPIAQMS
jgi:hypothetical protein